MYRVNAFCWTLEMFHLSIYSGERIVTCSVIESASNSQIQFEGIPDIFNAKRV